MVDTKDPKLLKKSLVRMYKKWVNNTDPTVKKGQKKNAAGGDNDLHKDFTKQRVYAEEALSNVTGKLTKSYQTFE